MLTSKQHQNQNMAQREERNFESHKSPHSIDWKFRIPGKIMFLNWWKSETQGIHIFEKNLSAVKNLIICSTIKCQHHSRLKLMNLKALLPILVLAFGQMRIDLRKWSTIEAIIQFTSLSSTFQFLALISSHVLLGLLWTQKRLSFWVAFRRCNFLTWLGFWKDTI